MTAKRSEFQELLDEAVPDMVEAAFGYVDGDPRVTDVWILATFEDNVSATATVYGIEGRTVPLADGMSKEYPEFGDANETIDAIDERLDELFFDIEDRSQLPSCLIVHHDVKAAKTDVTQSSERIPLKDGESYSAYAARWAREFTPQAGHS